MDFTKGHQMREAERKAKVDLKNKESRVKSDSTQLQYNHIAFVCETIHSQQEKTTTKN